MVDLHEADQPLGPAELIARLKGRQGLVCLITDTIDAPLLAACPDLKVVSNVAVGFNNIDVAAATSRGVVVTNTPDVLTETTADFAWTLLMATARRVVEADRYVREGKFTQWEYMVLLGGDVHGKTLGIIGFGRIGRAIARRAVGFDMRVLYQDAVAANPATERELRATRTDTATLLRESDFVTLHTPLLPETQHLINAKSLRTMKKTAYLINASRGPVVDEAALAQALKEGWIAGAGLDVFHQEPLPADDPVLSLPNVVLSPHNAGQTPEVIRDGLLAAVQNTENFLKGKPTNLIVAPMIADGRALGAVVVAHRSRRRTGLERRVANVLGQLCSMAALNLRNAVLLRDIQLPQTLKASIESKQQAEQEALAMNFRLQKEKQEAERKRIEAGGIRDFQQIVAQGISAQLLEWKGIEATEKLAMSPNSKVVLIGSGKNGLPLILGQ